MKPFKPDNTMGDIILPSLPPSATGSTTNNNSLNDTANDIILPSITASTDPPSSTGH